MEPWVWFVPDLVAALMMPPVWLPNSALKLFVRTWNSRMASTPRTLPDALPAWLYSSFRLVPSSVNRFAVYRDPLTLSFAPNLVSRPSEVESPVPQPAPPPSV